MLRATVLLPSPGWLDVTRITRPAPGSGSTAAKVATSARLRRSATTERGRSRTSSTGVGEVRRRRTLRDLGQHRRLAQPCHVLRRAKRVGTELEQMRGDRAGQAASDGTEHQHHLGMRSGGLGRRDRGLQQLETRPDQRALGGHGQRVAQERVLQRARRRRPPLELGQADARPITGT